MIIILTLLAMARVTRLITTDTVFATPRNALVRWLLRDRDSHPVAYLIFCDWCASMYVGAAAAGAYAAWGETMPFMVVILALSGSYAAGFLASVTERGE